MATASSNGTMDLWNFAQSLDEPVTGLAGIVVEPEGGSDRGSNGPPMDSVWLSLLPLMSIVWSCQRTSHYFLDPLDLSIDKAAYGMQLLARDGIYISELSPSNQRRTYPDCRPSRYYGPLLFGGYI